MRQRHLPTLGLSWSHLPTLGPGIWTGSCGNGIFQVSVCGKQLQYCKKSETAITTTAPVLQRETERETAITTTAAVLQRDREKLQLLRPLQYCRLGETAIATTAPILQREKLQLLRPNKYCREMTLQLLRPPQYCRLGETAITSTAPVLQKKRTCNYYDRSSIAEKERGTALTSIAKREKLLLLRPFQHGKQRETASLTTAPVLQCCRDRETATTTTAPNQKLEGCKLGRIQSWKMCFIPTVGCWKLGCASSNFAAATICIYVHVQPHVSETVARFVHTHMHVYVCLSLYVYTHTHVYMFANKYTYLHAHIHTDRHDTCSHAYSMYIHTYMICLHLYIYIFTRT